MDRFFVDANNIDLDNQKLCIYGDDVKHITKVLRYNKGDKIEICDGNNNEYICEIYSCNKDFVELDILEKIDINRESKIKVRLYQGLPKNTKMEIILQKLTECGVSEIILVNTERTVVNLDDKKADKKFERWERILYEAAKQSKRGVVPKLSGIMTFKEAIEDMKSNDINMSPYEEEKSLGIKEFLASNDVKNIVDKKAEVKVGIFIGPEGGFTEKENSVIKSNDISSVTMGPRIFRTETASIAATVITMYELGDIGNSF